MKRCPQGPGRTHCGDARAFLTLIGIVAAVTLLAFACHDARAQATPEQTIAGLQQVIARQNACIDAYTNWVAAEQRAAQAQAQIVALTKERDELKAKQPAADSAQK